MLIKYKTYKQYYIYIEKTFIISKVANLVTKKEGSSYSKGKTPIKRVCRERYYKRYKEIKHNFYTYIVEIEDIEDSKASK